MLDGIYRPEKYFGKWRAVSYRDRGDGRRISDSASMIVRVKNRIEFFDHRADAQARCDELNGARHAADKRS